MNQKMILGPKDKPTKGKWLLLSLQHVFAMFGATVLVPLLVNLASASEGGGVVLDTGVTLIASGIGTLIYILCTKGKVPIYLGSSFAYIGAMSTVAAYAAINGTSHTGLFIGLMAVGLIYVVISVIIRFVGSGWLKKLLPPIVVGPMIIIIGLGLAPIAVQQSGLAGLISATGTFTDGIFVPSWNLTYSYPDISGLAWKIPLVAVSTFATVVIVAIKGKGFFKIIPFLTAIVVGYILSAILGLVDLKQVFVDYSFIQLPNFTFLGSYKLDFSAVLMFAPIAFVTIAEHIGDHTVLGEICEKDFITDPGLDKTLLGDGIATFVSATIGGPANTSYGENTGVVAMTKVASVWVVGLAAIFAILLGFLGYIQAFITSIPWAVIGGMTVVLYGLIAGNGVRVLVKAKVDFSNMKNLIVVATMLVIGLGGAVLSLGTATFMGMSLAAIVGIVLNQIIPNEKVTEIQ